MGKKWTQEQKDRARLKRERAYFHGCYNAWLAAMNSAANIHQAGSAISDFAHAMAQGWCEIPECKRISNIAESDYVTIFGDHWELGDRGLLGDLDSDLTLIEGLHRAGILTDKQLARARGHVTKSLHDTLNELGMGYWVEADACTNYLMVISGIEDRARVINSQEK